VMAAGRWQVLSCLVGGLTHLVQEKVFGPLHHYSYITV